MDFQNRVGHKTGSGAPANAQDIANERKERLRRLALETIDLSKDPYLMRNHVGQYECKLCLTQHTNEASYLAHTQGKKHQTNLARRAAKEKADSVVLPAPRRTAASSSIRIGRPGYRVTKMRDPETNQKAMLFEIDFPEILDDTKPRHRFMSAYEQRVEASDSKYQYLVFAAEPYETIAFKVPNMEVDKGEGQRNSSKYYCNWDADTKTYTLQIHLKRRTERLLPALPQKPTTFLPIGVRW